MLPPADYVPKFRRALPSAAFRWVEECGHVPHLEQPEVLAAAVVAFLRGAPVAGDADADAGLAAASSPLARLDVLLDTPLLDTNVRGGPLEPLKRAMRAEPELAQVGASVVAIAFFGVLGRLLVGLLA